MLNHKVTIVLETVNTNQSINSFRGTLKELTPSRTRNNQNLYVINCNFTHDYADFCYNIIDNITVKNYRMYILDKNNDNYYVYGSLSSEFDLQAKLGVKWEISYS